MPLALSVWHLRMCMFGVPPCECGGPCLSRLSRLPAAAALLLGWLSVHAPAPFCSAPPCHSWPKGCCLVSPGLASTCLAWEAGKAGKASRVLLRRTAAIDGRACFLLPVGCWLLHTAYMLAPSMLLLQRSRRRDCIFCPSPAAEPDRPASLCPSRSLCDCHARLLVWEAPLAADPCSFTTTTTTDHTTPTATAGLRRRCRVAVERSPSRPVSFASRSSAATVPPRLQQRHRATAHLGNIASRCSQSGVARAPPAASPSKLPLPSQGSLLSFSTPSIDHTTHLYDACRRIVNC